jgi:hypothetical protein
MGATGFQQGDANLALHKEKPPWGIGKGLGRLGDGYVKGVEWQARRVKVQIWCNGVGAQVKSARDCAAAARRTILIR